MGEYIAVNKMNFSFLAWIGEDCSEKLVHGSNPRSTGNHANCFMSAHISPTPGATKKKGEVTYFPPIYTSG